MDTSDRFRVYQKQTIGKKVNNLYLYEYATKSSRIFVLPLKLFAIHLIEMKL